MGGNWTKQPQIGPPGEGSPGRRTLIVILVICICRYFAIWPRMCRPRYVRAMRGIARTEIEMTGFYSRTAKCRRPLLSYL